MSNPDESESTQALVTAMQIVCTEAKNPKNPGAAASMPSTTKLRAILQKLLSTTQSNAHLFARFKEYGTYLDIVFSVWKLLPELTIKAKDQNTEIYMQNFLELISTIPISAEVQENKQLLCCAESTFDFDYPAARKNLNKVWACIMQWTLSDKIHKQLLVVLLEKVLTHLDKPILLTDFLMDSLDVGGPVSLLALQGVFTLIQQHNLTYPRLYEKLYSMFEPEIFHTKYKSRLFYLADIFLSSSHLPENLVAAFAKRLARLALVAPAQDVTVIIYFIGNLIVRHPGLKRLISRPSGDKVPRDPFLMDERDPLQSNALDSSLWEIASLQAHVIPTVAQAAKLVSNPPRFEWNLSSLLDIDENDVSVFGDFFKKFIRSFCIDSKHLVFFFFILDFQVFDQEILKRSKDYALKFERPQTAFVSREIDSFSRHWNLFQ